MGAFHDWEALCGKYESAQDDCTVAYLAITARLFTGGSDGRGTVPTATELARWDAARERLTNIDLRMRTFIARLRELSLEVAAAGSRGDTDESSELH